MALERVAVALKASFAPRAMLAAEEMKSVALA